MWIVLWIVSAWLAAWGCEGSAQVATTDLAELWARSLDGLADMQIEPHQRAWLKLTRPLGLVENTALIATPNEFVKEQLETRLRARITHARAGGRGARGGGGREGPGPAVPRQAGDPEAGNGTLTSGPLGGGPFDPLA